MGTLEAVRLPRGKHTLTRAEVVTSQRARLLAGMAQTAAEKGLAKTTVADVIRHAGVSRETFYEHFSDKDDCFLAAFDAGVDTLLASLTAAVGDDAAGGPLDRLDSMLTAYLGALAAEPAFARTFLVESYAAGPRAVERRGAVQQRFVDAVADVLGLDQTDSSERFACEAIVAAVSSLVTTRVGAGQSDQLPALREPLMVFIRRLGLTEDS